MMRALCLRALKCGSGKRKNILLSCERASVSTSFSHSARVPHLSLSEEVWQELHGVGSNDADVFKVAGLEMIDRRLDIVVVIRRSWFRGSCDTVRPFAFRCGREKPLLPSQRGDLVRHVLTDVRSDLEACGRLVQSRCIRRKVGERTHHQGVGKERR